MVPGRGVDPIDADEAHASLLEGFPHLRGGAALLPAQTVLPGDDDAGRLPGLTGGQGLPKARSRHGFDPDTFCSTTSAASSTPACPD